MACRNVIVTGLFENETLNLSTDGPVCVSEVKEHLRLRKVRLRERERGGGREEMEDESVVSTFSVTPKERA